MLLVDKFQEPRGPEATLRSKMGLKPTRGKLVVAVHY